MVDILPALLIFILLVAASLGSLEIYARLPDRYKQDDTFNVVRLVAGIFIMMTSLVLGLMINSSRAGFETIDRNVHGFATDLILLDKTLEDYGPAAEDARKGLIAYVEQALAGTWPAHGPVVVADKSAEQLLNEVGRKLRAIAPPDAEHLTIWQDARQRYQKVVERRWVLVEESEYGIPGKPFIFMVVAWLVLIFGSLGLRAPRNAIVVASFVLSAGLISAALYLILDMDQPFSGPIRVSPAPLERALAEMQP